MSDTRSSLPPFPSLLVAGITKEALKKWSSEVVVGLDWVFAHVDAVASYKEMVSITL